MVIRTLHFNSNWCSRPPGPLSAQATKAGYTDRSSSLLPLPVRKLQILLPIVSRHVVLAGADVIGHVVHNGLLQTRHLAGVQTFLTQQFESRAGVQGAQEFA